jgi:transcriptional regulator with XRE-family HTH domain
MPDSSQNGEPARTSGSNPDTASISTRATIASARRALGIKLASLRRAAGYTQVEFAPLTGYGRSTLANVETGRQNVPRAFWRRCATALGDDTFLNEFDHIEAMVQASRRDAVTSAQAEREARVRSWERACTVPSGIAPDEIHIWFATDDGIAHHVAIPRKTATVPVITSVLQAMLRPNETLQDPGPLSR